MSFKMKNERSETHKKMSKHPASIQSHADGKREEYLAFGPYIPTFWQCAV